MRSVRFLAASLVPLLLLSAGCNDDSAVDAGDSPAPSSGDGDAIGVAPDGSDVDLPDRPPDLRGTITAITPFEPVTEDCTATSTGSPDAAVSSGEPPPCSSADDVPIGTILVEEDPADPQGGRKVVFSVGTDAGITGETTDGTKVGVFADFVAGQVVEAWVSDGVCAESYPEQCGLEAVRVIG